LIGQIYPPLTQDQIGGALALWNNADTNGRYALLFELQSLRALYRQSTIDALSRLSASRAISACDLTEELANTMFYHRSERGNSGNVS
jgi:hypothetical protein